MARPRAEQPPQLFRRPIGLGAISRATRASRATGDQDFSSELPASVQAYIARKGVSAGAATSTRLELMLAWEGGSGCDSEVGLQLGEVLRAIEHLQRAVGIAAWFQEAKAADAYVRWLHRETVRVRGIARRLPQRLAAVPPTVRALEAYRTVRKVVEVARAGVQEARDLRSDQNVEIVAAALHIGAKLPQRPFSKRLAAANRALDREATCTANLRGVLSSSEVDRVIDSVAQAPAQTAADIVTARHGVQMSGKTFITKVVNASAPRVR